MLRAIQATAIVLTGISAVSPSTYAASLEPLSYKEALSRFNATGHDSPGVWLCGYSITDPHFTMREGMSTSLVEVDERFLYLRNNGEIGKRGQIYLSKLHAKINLSPFPVRSNRVTRRDYDFEQPRLLLEAAAKSEFQPDLEDYDYPGRYTERTRGKHLAQRSLERHRADYQLAEGRSDQPRLLSGHLLEISDHPRCEWNDLWLLHEVIHQGKQPQVLEESISNFGSGFLPSPNGQIGRTADLGSFSWPQAEPQGRGESRGAGGEGLSGNSDDFHQGYRNHFSASPWNILYRPPLQHPKPRVLGSQTAVVTGPRARVPDLL